VVAGARRLETRCCIAGGGPAGLMLGLLLARSGVPVVVLEKHADFLRDFRGDTIHPSTLEVVNELGLLDEFLALPHDKVADLAVQFVNGQFLVADFRRLPVRCGFIAMMPQWDFLDFLAGCGRRESGYTLLMRTEATGLIEEGGRVVGVRARDDDGELEVRADLTVACDGRHSTLREAAGFAPTNLGAPIDVLWFRISRRPDDIAETGGRFGAGTILVMINRGDYWQCAYVIPKGSVESVRARGLPLFRDGLAAFAPMLADRVGELRSWDDLKLLTVRVDRLPRWWRPGLLCIGDAAHAMSPVGGVGINLAIQDAVATANRLAAALRERRVTDSDLAAVQARRRWPTRATQAVQLLVQNIVIAPSLGRSGPPRAPLPVRLMARWPWLRRLPARLIGMGFRPEHWKPT
jgi:2-polyprenyl-6-methoxyphenol hydroxylase-like FAD-dependent oxidoreductase